MKQSVNKGYFGITEANFVSIQNTKTGSEEHGIIGNNSVATSFLAMGGMKLDRVVHVAVRVTRRGSWALSGRNGVWIP